jgi:hypothetical protein
VIQNDLQREAANEEPEYTGPRCCWCNLVIDDYFARCTLCKYNFCCYGVAPEAGENCVRLNVFSADLSFEQAKADFICPICWNHSEQGFYPVCSRFHCGIYKAEGIFMYIRRLQHHIRPLPRMTVQVSGVPAPRMVMIVFYLDQFWPQTKHLCSLVLARWKTNGWPVGPCSPADPDIRLTIPQCLIQPVKLDELAERQEVLEDW